MINLVADTGPLNYLIQIDKVQFLPMLFGDVFVPSSVKRELLHPNAPRIVRAWMESPPDWLNVRDPLSYINEAGLGRAELDSISLSIEFGAWLLIDDQEARIFAHRKVTKILGTIGMLELGSANRLIDDLQGAYTKLQATNHRHAPALISDALFRDRQRR